MGLPKSQRSFGTRVYAASTVLRCVAQDKKFAGRRLIWFPALIGTSTPFARRAAP
jgi:hypothetical protein